MRRNVRDNATSALKLNKELLIERLYAEPPEHPGDLFYRLQKISQHALELGMLDWRDGHDPRGHFAEIQSSFALALDVRPDIRSTYRHAGFMPILFDLMDWKWPYDVAPPESDDLKFDIIWMERWISAGLADPTCWPSKAKTPPAKIQLINTTLDDYWALLTDQVDPDEGIQRCISNYERRATHPTFKAIGSYLGGGPYNELYVDFMLAAIMKKRGLRFDSVHDWKRS